MCTTHISGVVHTHPPSTWELEAEGSGVSGHPELQSHLEVSLGYMRPPLKGSKKKTALCRQDIKAEFQRRKFSGVT